MDDDDFMGEIEFDLSTAQGSVVQEAIQIASANVTDEFVQVNPLIAIMQWWEETVPEKEKLRETPESTLTEACRRYIIAHDNR